MNDRPVPPVHPPTRQPRRERFTGLAGLRVLIGVSIVATAVLAAAAGWLGPSKTGDVSPSVPRSAAIASTPISPARPRRRFHPASAAAPLMILTSTGESRCWLRIRRAGPTGTIVYQGTLGPGTRLALRTKQPLWMRVGWVPHLRVVLNDRVRSLSGRTGEFIVHRSTITRTE
jgi:hypothetical protein